MIHLDLITPYLFHTREIEKFHNTCVHRTRRINRRNGTILRRKQKKKKKKRKKKKRKWITQIAKAKLREFCAILWREHAYSVFGAWRWVQSIPILFVPLILAFSRDRRIRAGDVSSFARLSTWRKWTVNRPRYAAPRCVSIRNRNNAINVTRTLMETRRVAPPCVASVARSRVIDF